MEEGLSGCIMLSSFCEAKQKNALYNTIRVGGGAKGVGGRKVSQQQGAAWQTQLLLVRMPRVKLGHIIIFYHDPFYPPDEACRETADLHEALEAHRPQRVNARPAAAPLRHLSEWSEKWLRFSDFLGSWSHSQNDSHTNDRAAPLGHLAPPNTLGHDPLHFRVRTGSFDSRQTRKITACIMFVTQGTRRTELQGDGGVPCGAT